MEKMPNNFSVIIAGVFALIWLYIAARVVTRAILRTIDKRSENGEE